MGTTRRKFTAEFKKKVVLEALKERNTIQELAAKFEIHPQQITDWKKHFLENSGSAFERSPDPDQHGWQGPGERQYFYRTIVEKLQIRICLFEPCRRWIGAVSGAAGMV